MSGGVSRRDFFSLGARRVLPDREGVAAVGEALREFHAADAGVERDPAAARSAREAAAVDAWGEQSLGAWADGDLAIQARLLTSAAEVLMAAARVRPGDAVLDVGAGDGTVTLMAAAAGGRVTALEASAPMAAAGRTRCAAADVHWELGDAAALPFADATFDCCLSNFGAIFAERPRQVAAELARVTRPGGFVGLTAWAPDGIMGRVLDLAARLSPPPPGAARAVRWGRFESVFLLMDRVVDGFEAVDHEAVWAFASVDAARDALAAVPGPLRAALAAVDEDARQAGLGELLTLVRSSDDGTGGAVRLPVSYSVITGTARRP